MIPVRRGVTDELGVDRILLPPGPYSVVLERVVLDRDRQTRAFRLRNLGADLSFVW